MCSKFGKNTVLKCSFCQNRGGPSLLCLSYLTLNISMWSDIGAYIKNMSVEKCYSPQIDVSIS